jgi:hypothetical protein
MLPPVVLLFTLLSFFVVGFEVLFKCFVLPEACVKSILDVVVYTTGHMLLNLDPFVAINFVELHQL